MRALSSWCHIPVQLALCALKLRALHSSAEQCLYCSCVRSLGWIFNFFTARKCGEGCRSLHFVHWKQRRYIVHCFCLCIVVECMQSCCAAPVWRWALLLAGANRGHWFRCCFSMARSNIIEIVVESMEGVGFELEHGFQCCVSVGLSKWTSMNVLRLG